VFVPLLNHQKIIGYKGNRMYRTAARRFSRYPFATLAMTAFAPMPFFPFKFLSFSTSYPLVKYLAALALGRYPKYLLIAWAGSMFKLPMPLVFGILLAIVAIVALRSGPQLWRRWMRGANAVEGHTTAAPSITPTLDPPPQ
jgi:uncharacterized membrane protein YdjX (TVP38/TMEM64 family)